MANGCILFEQINQVSLAGLGPERGVANLQPTDLDSGHIANLSRNCGSAFASNVSSRFEKAGDSCVALSLVKQSRARETAA